MEKKEKELLLKDLCARLPYNFVYCYCNAPLADGSPIILTPVVISNLMNATDGLVIKPYLRPMLSMTEEERKELEELTGGDEISISGFGIRVLCGGCYGMMWDDCSEIVDWLNAHHFDYRGLICKGLALEAPENMYV